MSDYIIGADIGGTWIRVALCSKDLNEQNLKIKMLTTPKADELSISKALSSLITSILYEPTVAVEPPKANPMKTINMTGSAIANIMKSFDRMTSFMYFRPILYVVLNS